jgi:hypothetical protein
MSLKDVSRRDILKTLSWGAAGSVLQVIPAQAAEYVHRMVASEKAKAPKAGYSPKFFAPAAYQTLGQLCQAIIPADADSGGAIEAGAPEFIDLITSENPEYQLQLGGGLMWLDGTSIDRYGKSYLDCAPEQRDEILHRIAYRASAVTDPSLGPGVEFFALLRSLTADAFFTSRIGIDYLGYIGSQYLTEFKGCPPVPAAPVSET